MRNFKEFYLQETKAEEEIINDVMANIIKDVENELSEEELIEKYENLSEKTLGKISNILDDQIEEEEGTAVFSEQDCEDADLNERLFKKIVVRGGKKIKKFKSDRPGYRVVLDPSTGRPKEVRMKAAEVRKRKKSQKLGAIKRKAKQATARIKRAISKRKRATFGLKK